MSSVKSVVTQFPGLTIGVQVEFHRGGWPTDQRTLEDADTLMIISDGRDGDLYSEALHLESPARGGLGRTAQGFADRKSVV